MAPYHKPVPADRVQKLLKAVAVAHQNVRKAEETRAAAARRRLEAVADAAQAGASLRDIAEVAGVSPETVRKMIRMDKFGKIGVDA